MSELDDLMPTSPDHNAARLAELKRLFPDLFSDEGRLDVKAVRKLADPDMLDMEKFRFTWYGKSRARRKAFSPSSGALVYDAERSVNPELADGNMIIEGENLEVLKLLTSAYSEKVKCIYIDPPYNTGNDFIYPDNYAQGKKEYWEQNGIFKDGVKMDSNPESNGRFHSDWLSMMFSRLLVARLLLKDDGVIFVSIDDNEVHNLRKLMDEVFGEENFVALVAVVNNFKGRNDREHFATAHEYLLVYSKDQFVSYGLPLTEKKISEYNQVDKHNNKFQWRDLRKRGGADTREVRPNLYYPIFYSKEEQYFSLERQNINDIEIFPMKSDKTEGCWRWGKDKVAQNLETLSASYVSKSNKWNVSYPVYLKIDDEQRVSKPKSVWIGSEYSTDLAQRSMRKLFDDGTWNVTPKPVEFLKNILRLSTSGQDYCLDFFAGSGTLAQAILELNAEGENNRQFILVQLPEVIDKKEEAYKAGFKKISDITIERVKRVIEGHGETPSLFGARHEIGFKVYRLSGSRFPRVTFQPKPDKSTEENIAALKQYIVEKEASMYMTFERDAVFDEVLLKHGFPLNYTLEKQAEFPHNDVFLARATGKEMLICLDTLLHEETVAHFKTDQDPFFICLERALNTDKKWTLKQYLGEKLKTL